MLSNYLSIDVLEAKMQSSVAKFLSEKEVLVTATYDQNPSVSNQAKKLLVTQKKLENKLPDVLRDIKNKKTDIGTLINNSIFYYDMRRHINNVEQFRKGVKFTPSIFKNMDINYILKYGLFGLGILMLIRKPTILGATTTAVGSYLMSTKGD